MTFDNKSSKSTHHAIIVGEGTLADSVASVLAERQISTTITHGTNISTGLLNELSEAGTPATLIFNLWYPNPKSDQPEMLGTYPQQLLEQSATVSESMSQEKQPAIINFAFLPAIYVGTEMEDHVASLRGGITGVTRTLARKFGRKGIRVTCVQAGLVDMPETQSWVSETVKQVQVPSKRWATSSEVAKFMVFLAVDSLYTTGQTMIIDGGLTAGITGT